MRGCPSAHPRVLHARVVCGPARARVSGLAAPSDVLASSDLHRVGCPTLIIAGEKDGFMDVSLARDMKASLTEATLEILPSGHAAALEVPEAFNRTVLDFLEKLRWGQE